MPTLWRARRPQPSGATASLCFVSSKDNRIAKASKTPSPEEREVIRLRCKHCKAEAPKPRIRLTVLS